jgi:glycosyltransferase involved in cell wall biosynthesis
VHLCIIAENIRVSVHLEMAKALAALGHRVEVWSTSPDAPPGPGFHVVEEGGVRIHFIHDRWRHRAAWLPDKLLQRLTRRRRFWTELSSVARFVRERRRADLFFVEGDYPMGVMVALAASGRRIRWMVTAHDTQDLNLPLVYPGRHRRRRFHLAKQWVYRRATVVRANSPLTRSALIESGCPADKIATVPMHIPSWIVPTDAELADLPAFKRRSREELNARFGIPAAHALLLMMCRMSPEKGIGLAVEALARLVERRPQTTLLVCGADRGVRAPLEALASRLGVRSNLIFGGNIPHYATRPYYAGATLHLAPSVIDTFNFAVIEAALLSTYTLGSQGVGAMPWIVESGRGRVVSGRDPAAWAQAIAQALEAPPLTAGAGARCDFLLDHLSAAAIAPRLLAAGTDA